jgi:hypothetical protein
MVTQDDPEYVHALRTQLAERRALWEVLQEFIGIYANSTDDPSAALQEMHDRVTLRLDRKEADAKQKNLELSLAYVKGSVDRFFSELSKRTEEGEL